MRDAKDIREWVMGKQRPNEDMFIAVDKILEFIDSEPPCISHISSIDMTVPQGGFVTMDIDGKRLAINQLVFRYCPRCGEKIKENADKPLYSVV